MLSGSEANTAEQNTKKMTINKEHCFIVMSADGYWARGKTIPEAAAACVKQGATKSRLASITVVVGDEDAVVDSYGFLCYGGAEKTGAKSINGGMVARLGGLLAKKGQVGS